VKSDEKIKNKEKHLISYQTREDIVSSVLGFEELCLYKLNVISCAPSPPPTLDFRDMDACPRMTELTVLQ
jgi:hypothetical protein